MNELLAFIQVFLFLFSTARLYYKVKNVKLPPIQILKIVFVKYSSVLILFLVMTQASFGQINEQEFKTPKDEYKPKTWMHAMSGNMSKEGMTKDLEAMSKAGIGGLLLFNVSQGIPNGDVIYNSDLHHQIITHAAKEAERLGLTFGVHNCDGWSSSGGPWVKPEQSMKVVTWSEIVVDGGRKETLQLPSPPKREGYYEDIAVYAYPSLPSEVLDFAAKPKIITSDPSFDILKAKDRNTEESTKLTKGMENEPYIIYDFGRNHPIAAIDILFSDRNIKCSLSTSLDGVNFKHVRNLNMIRPGKGDWAFNDAFAPIISRYFKVSFSNDINIKEIQLSATQKIENYFGRTGFAHREDSQLKPLPTAATNMVIDKSKLILLTNQLTNNGTINLDLPAGKYTILRMGFTSTGAFNHPASDQGRGLEVDKFDRPSMKMHYDTFVHRVVKNTKAIAPNAMAYSEIDSYEMGGQNWTKGFESIFSASKGYDILQFLPLFAGKYIDDAQSSDAILTDLRDLQCKLMLDNYFGYFTELCNQDGIKSYIEPYGGGPFNDLEVGGKADIPMGEFWMNRPITMIASAVSSAHIYGKPVISAESFTAEAQLNWKGHPGMAKISGDRAWSFGINEFMFHRYAHQANTHVLPGMTMNQWGSHFDGTQTWWLDAGKAWFQYISRGSYLLQQGVPVSDLLVFVGDGSPSTNVDRADFKTKLPNGYNYDCVNADVLINRIKVTSGAMVLPEGTSYHVLVLMNTKNMTLATLRRIAELSRQGVTIVGEAPLKLSGYINSKMATAEFGKLKTEVWSKTTTYTAQDWSAIFDKIKLIPDSQTSHYTDKPFIHRKTLKDDIYFIFNEDNTARNIDCSFRVVGKVPELWNAKDGSIKRLAKFNVQNGLTNLNLKLESEESVFIVFRDRIKSKPLNTITSIGDDHILPEFDEKGNIVFTTPTSNEISYSYADDKSKSVKVGSNPKSIDLNNNWNVSFKNDIYEKTHSFSTLVDWKDHSDDDVKFFSGTASYNKTFYVSKEQVSKNVKSTIHLGKVDIAATVFVNDQVVSCLFMPPYEVDITQYLNVGQNKIEIKVTNQWTNRLIGEERFPPQYGEVKLEGNFPKKKMVDWYKNNEPMPVGPRTTYTTAAFYKKDSPLLSAGMIGPVVIKFENRYLIKGRR